MGLQTQRPSVELTRVYTRFAHLSFPRVAAARGIPDAARRKTSGFFARGSHTRELTDQAKPGLTRDQKVERNVKHRILAGRKSKLLPKICIVSSCGGHLTEVRMLKPAYERYEHFYVINERILLPEDMDGRTYFIRHSERDLLFLVNLWEAWRILRCERPCLILSTGAGPVVPFALIGKILRIPTVFVEDMNRMTRPSLTGRIMYHLADRFFYQWQALERFFPNGICGGPLA
jgi:beta-1,4-N-acetylglucosaminyltransferase